MTADPTRPGRRGHSESAGLLRQLLENPVSEGYTRAVRPTEQTWWGRLLAILVVATLTAGATWGARELQAALRGADSVNRTLREEVRARAEQQDALENEIAGLHDSVQAARGALLVDDRALLDNAAQLGAHTGAVPVTGEGLVVTLDDAAAATNEERIHDFDLQVLVNGLWASGAEAIAVNGQRLATSTAIRTAGSAVLVNLVPVAGPYVIEAIGHPEDLQVRLAQTRAAGHLAVLRDTYGVTVDIEPSAKLELGAVQQTSTRWARSLVPTEGDNDGE